MIHMCFQAIYSRHDRMEALSAMESIWNKKEVRIYGWLQILLVIRDSQVYI